MRTVLTTFRRVPYAGAVFLGLAVVVAALSVEVTALELQPFARLSFQVVTGALLLTCLSYQWVLFAKRALKDARGMRSHVKMHRWVGVSATLLFAVHAVRVGHVWMSLLSAVFFLVALTGVLNREVLGYRSNLLYLIWLALHIGLSAAMVPLIAVHIWVALAYQ